MKIQSLILASKYREPQAVDSDVMDERSGITNLLSLRIENWWGLIVGKPLVLGIKKEGKIRFSQSSWLLS